MLIFDAAHQGRIKMEHLVLLSSKTNAKSLHLTVIVNRCVWRQRHRPARFGSANFGIQPSRKHLKN
jgi:hypothetical protein